MNRLRFVLQLMDKVSGPAKRISKAMRGARNAMAVTGKAADRVSSSMRRMGTAGRAATFSAKKMGEGAFVTAGALNLAASSMGQIAGMGKRALEFPNDKAVDFERQMSRVKALSQSTSAEFEAQTKIARELGRTTVFTASEAAQGLGFLAMAGFSATKQVEALPSVLKLAAAADMELGRTAEISSNIMGAFGIEASRMVEVGDVLTATFTNSNTTLETLGETMKYAGPQAKAAGVSLQEVAKFAAVLGNAGIDGSLAGTALRTVLLRLSAPPKKAAKALKSLGIVTQDAAGNLRPPVLMLREMAEAMEDLGSAQKLKAIDAIFGRYASSGVAEVLDKLGAGGLDAGIVGFDELSEKIDKSAGLLDKVYEIMTSNRYGKLRELASAFEDVAIAIGDAFGPTLLEGIKHAKDMIETTGKWVKANPELTASILKFAAVGTILMTLLSGLALIGSTVAFIFGGISKVITGIAAASRVAFKPVSKLVDLFSKAKPGPLGPARGPGGGLNSMMPKSMPTMPSLKPSATGAKGGFGLAAWAAEQFLNSESGQFKGTAAEGFSWLWNQDKFNKKFSNKKSESGRTSMTYAPNIQVNAEGQMDPEKLAKEIERVNRIEADRMAMSGAY